MLEFVSYVVKNLVENPDGVKVEQEEVGQALTFKVTVDSADLGKVIGKKGNTINALRTLALNLGAREGKKVRVEVS